MRRFFAVCIILCALVQAHADPYRYRWRQFADHSTDLAPLFNWWQTAQSVAMTNLDLNMVDSNSMAMEASNSWVQLPTKPTPDWCWIRAGNISTIGKRWLVQDAAVYLAPQIYKHVTIYLMNPPTTEYQDFAAAKNNLAALTAQLNTVTQQEGDALTNMAIAQSAVDKYPKTTGIVAYGLPVVSTAAMANSNLVSATAALQAVQTRKAAISKQMQPFSEYLGHFPDQTTYTLDHFARYTGKTTNGIEVYDLGLAPGLNYPAQ